MWKLHAISPSCWIDQDPSSWRRDAKIDFGPQQNHSWVEEGKGKRKLVARSSRERDEEFIFSLLPVVASCRPMHKILYTNVLRTYVYSTKNENSRFQGRVWPSNLLCCLPVPSEKTESSLLPWGLFLMFSTVALNFKKSQKSKFHRSSPDRMNFNYYNRLNYCLIKTKLIY